MSHAARVFADIVSVLLMVAGCVLSLTAVFFKNLLHPWRVILHLLAGTLAIFTGISSMIFTTKPKSAFGPKFLSCHKGVVLINVLVQLVAGSYLALEEAGVPVSLPMFKSFMQYSSQLTELLPIGKTILQAASALSFTTAICLCLYVYFRCCAFSTNRQEPNSVVSQQWIYQNFGGSSKLRRSMNYQQAISASPYGPHNKWLPRDLEVHETPRRISALSLLPQYEMIKITRVDVNLYDLGEISPNMDSFRPTIGNDTRTLGKIRPTKLNFDDSITSDALEDTEDTSMIRISSPLSKTPRRLPKKVDAPSPPPCLISSVS